MRTYYLQDLSTYGTTWVFQANVWQQIIRQEVPLQSGMQLKFGSSKSQPWEFIIEDSWHLDKNEETIFYYLKHYLVANKYKKPEHSGVY